MISVMSYKVVLVFVFVTKIKGENLVCRKLNRSTNFNSIRDECGGQTVFMKGPPGEKGSKGRTGLPGRNGTKGVKGEPGSINKTLIEAICLNLLAPMQNKIEELKYQTTILQGMQTDIDVLQKKIGQDLSQGWNIFGNYMYKITGIKKNWIETREQCKEWGADLAVHGIRNSTITRYLEVEYSDFTNIWIGLTKVGNDFVWANDETANTSQLE